MKIGKGCVLIATLVPLGCASPKSTGLPPMLTSMPGDFGIITISSRPARLGQPLKVVFERVPLGPNVVLFIYPDQRWRPSPQPSLATAALPPEATVATATPTGIYPTPAPIPTPDFSPSPVVAGVPLARVILGAAPGESGRYSGELTFTPAATMQSLRGDTVALESGFTYPVEFADIEHGGHASDALEIAS